MTAFEEGIKLISLVRSPQDTLQTHEFLDVCGSVLPIVGELRIRKEMEASSGLTEQLI